MQALDEITEISLRRTPCFGECPVYQVTIWGDGRFNYVGEQYVEHQGEYSGQVNRWSLDKLAQLIKEVGFMDLGESYAVLLTCQPTVYTAVVMNGVKKEISNYGSGGPAVLWAIEELIDKLLSEAEWDKGSAVGDGQREERA